MILHFNVVSFNNKEFLMKNITECSFQKLQVMKTYLSKRELAKVNKQVLITKQNSIILSRYLLKDLIGNFVVANKKNIEIVNEKGNIGNPYVLNHGVPINLDVSISYSYPIVAVAVAKPNTKIGIDIEKCFSNPSESFLKFCFSTKELKYITKKYPRRFLEKGYTTLWCIKEVVGKLLGTGLSGNPKNIEVFLKDNKEVFVSLKDNFLGTNLLFRNKKLFLCIKYIDELCICYAKIL